MTRWVRALLRLPTAPLEEAEHLIRAVREQAKVAERERVQLQEKHWLEIALERRSANTTAKEPHP